MLKATPPLFALLLALQMPVAAVLAKDPGPSQLHPAVVTNLAVLARTDAPLKEKVDACRELARIGGREAIAPLAALLADEKLSHAARYGLETIPDPGVDRCFRQALGQLHGRQLAGVIGSIGVRRDVDAVKPLAKLLANADPEVAQAAARALGSIATATAIKALETGLTKAPPTNQLAFCEGLLRGAGNLLAAGKTSAAQKVYDRLRAQPLPHQARAGAWRGAILTRGKNALPLLQAALGSDDYALFVVGIRVSDEMPAPAVTLALGQQLAKANGDRAIMLLAALGRRGDAAGLPALAQTAATAEKPLRLAALHALSQCANAKAVPTFVALLADPDAELAKAAGESLAALPGDAAAQAILALFSSAQRDQRLTAMDLSARRRLSSALPALKQAARDPDPTLRRHAIKTFGSLAGTNDLAALLELVGRATEREDLETLEQALTAVCLRTGPPAACAPRIAANLPSFQPAQKCALVRTLNALGGPAALDAVRAAVRDTAPEVHAAALRALAAWNSPEAAPDLLELARTVDQPAERLLCLRGYLGFAGRAETAESQRLGMCRQAAGLALQPDEKKLLLAALGGIASTDALALVQPCLEDAAVQKEAASAALDIAAKILESPQAAPNAATLIESIGKVGQLNATPEITARAAKLLAQAKAKATPK